MKQPLIVRFAPSPNGYLHLGHAYSALLNVRFARLHHGEFLLRIEDIDVGRSRPAYIEAIYEDLDWLGIAWQHPVRKQSEHFEVYQAALQKLANMELLYPCTASRKEILCHIETLPNAADYPRDPEGGLLYPGLYRGASMKDYRREEGRQALRLDMDKAIALVAEKNRLPITQTNFVLEKQDEDAREGKLLPKTETLVVTPAQWGDIVLARKDIATSYHLSVVVDDALQGVTHVIRGQDLSSATDLHRLLQVLLGLEAPFYHHHELIKAKDSDKKLSKSAKDISLRSLRQQGWSADDVKHYLFGS